MGTMAPSRATCEAATLEARCAARASAGSALQNAVRRPIGRRSEVGLAGCVHLLRQLSAFEGAEKRMVITFEA